MPYLLDTHLLIWSAVKPEKLPRKSRDIIEDAASDIAFSAVSIWEAAIKASLSKPSFQIDVRRVRQGLLDNAIPELDVTSDHGMAVQNLPHIHGDPFDRLLIAQAVVEGMTLLTSDRVLSRYPGPIEVV